MRERKAFVALSLPASLLSAADDDRDGRLSAAESVAHAELLQRLVATMVHLSDGGTPARLLYARVMVERLDDDQGEVPRPATDVLVLLVGEFDGPPATLSIRIDGLERAPDDGRITVRTIRDGATEVATLRAGEPAHRFFASRLMRTGDGIVNGAAHIVTGTDHLLFLLTLVLAGAGWRYWTSVVSSFTVAHAVVLCAAVAGHAPPVSPALIEVLIAASIVLMAIRALQAQRGAARTRTMHEAALAAICGLVHGLGVAGAVQAPVAGGRPDLIMLGAFNVGVELAQLAVVLAIVALLGVVPMAARWWHRDGRHVRFDVGRLVPRVLAGGAGMAGLVWLLVRLPAIR